MLTGEKKAGLAAAIQDAHAQADATISPAQTDKAPDKAPAPDKAAPSQDKQDAKPTGPDKAATGPAPPRPGDKEPAKDAVPPPEPKKTDPEKPVAPQGQTVPWDRFKQVYDERRQFKGQLDYLTAQVHDLRAQLAASQRQPAASQAADPLDEVFGKGQQPDFARQLAPYEQRVAQLERAIAVQNLRAEIDQAVAANPGVPFEVLRQAVAVDDDADLDVVAKQWLHEQDGLKSRWRKEWEDERAAQQPPAATAAPPPAAPPRPGTAVSQTPPHVSRGVDLKNPAQRRRSLTDAIASATGWSR